LHGVALPLKCTDIRIIAPYFSQILIWSAWKVLDFFELVFLAGSTRLEVFLPEICLLAVLKEGEDPVTHKLSGSLIWRQLLKDVIKQSVNMRLDVLMSFLLVTRLFHQ